MGLDTAGAIALLAHVQFIRKIYSEWEKMAEKAIEKDRRTRGSPNNEGRLGWDSNESLWISTQRKLAKLHLNRTPKDLWQPTQEGYCSMIECGAARDIKSALVLLEQEIKVQIPILAELESARKASYLKYVAMANRVSTRDKLLQCQEILPTVLAGVHFQHYVPISKQNFGDCYSRVAYEPTSAALQDWGPRVQSAGLRQGSAASLATFVQAHQYFTESGHRPASGSSYTELHYSATNTQQDVESASEGGSEELSL
jgi:hypothetical protein